MGCNASAPERVAPPAIKGKPAIKKGQPPAARTGRRDSIRRAGVSAETDQAQQSRPDHTANGSESFNKKELHRKHNNRLSIRASVTIGHATIAQYEKDKATLSILQEATADNPLFAPLSDEQRQVVYGAMVDDTVEAGEIVIREGERGDLFYVVESGVFVAKIASRGAEPVKTYESRGCFGELALLYNSPRAATVSCTKGGRLWAIDRGVFNMIMIKSNDEYAKSTQEFLKTIDLCKGLETNKLELLASMVEEMNYSVGDYVWSAGATIDALYILREGEVEVCAAVDAAEGTIFDGKADEGNNQNVQRRTSFVVESFKGKKDSHRSAKLRRGDWYGSAILRAELAMTGRGNSFDLGEEPAGTQRESARDFLRAAAGGATHVAGGKALGRTKVLVLRLSSLRSAAASAVGDLPKQMSDSVMRHAERALSGFVSLTPLQRARLLTGLPARWVPAGKAVRSPSTVDGSLIRAMQLISKGRAHEALEDGSLPEVTQEDVEEDAGPQADGVKQGWLSCGSIVDESSLIDLAQPPTDEPVFAIGGDVQVVDLDVDVLVALSSVMAKAARRSDTGKSSHANEILSLDELTHVALLGAGGYGAVWLVQHQSNSHTYALKKMSKGHVVAKRQVDHVNNERKLLSLCDHPFLIELVSSFQDATNVYLMLELVLGGELFSYLDEHGALDTEPARFYTASVACALEYLQDRNVVYRDLKPENLLIDHEGYIKIVDFGFAKVVYQGEKTWTLCGTPEYLAPEVILRRGHDVRVDWWSLGILLIELFSGCTPFSSDDQFEIFKNIVKNEIDYDDIGMPSDATEFCKAVLVTDPSLRLGTFDQGGGLAVRNSDFLKEIDFVQLANRTLPAPYVPYIASSTDTRHSPDEEELEIPDSVALDPTEAKKAASYFPEFEVLGGGVENDWNPDEPATRARRKSEELTHPIAAATAAAAN